MAARWTSITNDRWTQLCNTPYLVADPKNDQFHRGSGCPNTSIMPQASPVAASMTVPSGSTLKATSYLGSANAIKCPHISHISHMFGEEANVVHVVSWFSCSVWTFWFLGFGHALDPIAIVICDKSEIRTIRTRMMSMPMLGLLGLRVDQETRHHEVWPADAQVTPRIRTLCEIFWLVFCKEWCWSSVKTWRGHHEKVIMAMSSWQYHDHTIDFSISSWMVSTGSTMVSRFKITLPSPDLPSSSTILICPRVCIKVCMCSWQDVQKLQLMDL